MNKKIFGLICGLILVLLLVVGCTKEQETGTSSKNSVTGKTISGVTEKQNNDFREIEVISKQYEFVPSLIKVKQGEKIRLILKSIDVPHSLAIKTPFLDVNQYVEAGTSEVIEFTATEKGEYLFKCAIYCGSGHREMRGSLVVE